MRGVVTNIEKVLLHCFFRPLRLSGAAVTALPSRCVHSEQYHWSGRGDFKLTQGKWNFVATVSDVYRYMSTQSTHPLIGALRIVACNHLSIRPLLAETVDTLVFRIAVLVHISVLDVVFTFCIFVSVWTNRRSRASATASRDLLRQSRTLACTAGALRRRHCRRRRTR